MDEEATPHSPRRNIMTKTKRVIAIQDVALRTPSGEELKKNGMKKKKRKTKNDYFRL